MSRQTPVIDSLCGNHLRVGLPVAERQGYKNRLVARGLTVPRCLRNVR
jgi:hypothetical protein